MRFILITIIAALSIAAQAQKLAWTDINPASAEVLRYIVYEAGTTTVLDTVDLPKTTDDPKDVFYDLSPDLAGKTVTVTAVNSLGLESDPAKPPVTLPTIAEAPSSVRLALDFTNSKLEVIWQPESPEDALVTKFVVYRDLGADEPVKVAEVDSQTDRASIDIPEERATFFVVARGFWGDSPRSPSVSTPTLIVPVTNLRALPLP